MNFKTGWERKEGGKPFVTKLHLPLNRSFSKRSRQNMQVIALSHLPHTNFCLPLLSTVLLHKFTGISKPATLDYILLFINWVFICYIIFFPQGTTSHERKQKQRKQKGKCITQTKRTCLLIKLSL